MRASLCVISSSAIAMTGRIWGFADRRITGSSRPIVLLRVVLSVGPRDTLSHHLLANCQRIAHSEAINTKVSINSTSKDVTLICKPTHRAAPSGLPIIYEILRRKPSRLQVSEHNDSDTSISLLVATLSYLQANALLNKIQQPSAFDMTNPCC